MSKEILLNPDMLYNWDFKVDARGYRPQEVDKVLDMVISDYNAYNSMIREKDRQIDALNNQILELKQKLRNAKEIWEDSKYLFNGLKQECFYALYFNNKQELIERKLLFMGTINKSIIHPREIFKEAYRLSASSIVCMHNHPSNDIRPSKEDKLFTENIVKAGMIQGIPVLDHIIVSDFDYYSFYDHGNILNL